LPGLGGAVVVGAGKKGRRKTQHPAVSRALVLRQGSWGRSSGRLPAVGQQGKQVFFAGRGKDRRQAGKDVSVVDPRIVAVTLTGGQQAEMDRRRTAAAVVTAKEPVPTSQAQPAQRVLAFVVVDVSQPSLQ